MTKIGSWSANIPSLAPFLTTAARGETLELRPSGSWTATHANELESLFDATLPKLQQVTNLKIDMAEVRELDTLGAWLLEKMLRCALASGRPATLVGVAGRYAGLIDDVRQVNRHKPANRTAHNAILARLESVGRATFNAV
jgi:phospholipid/cholesterol/gamma-HCH transport system permease protein